MATIRDVAKRAGVSVATVSRVTSGTVRVSAATKAKVLAAIQELGYVPHVAARSLARQDTQRIAVVTTLAQGAYFSGIISGAEPEARGHGYDLLPYGIHTDDAGDDRFRSFISTRVDGAILTCLCPGSCMEALYEQGIPYVTLSPGWEGMKGDAVHPDNCGGTYEAVTHLIQDGYRRIALIGGPRNMSESESRAKGYCQALRDHGLSCDPEWSVHGDFSETSGHQALMKLLDQGAPVQAVFAANDAMAIGAMNAARDRGLTVPDDIAFVGFDDISVAAYVVPPLTTVAQDIVRCGTLAVQLLLQRIEDPEREPQDIALPTRLVVRRSCGCGRGSRVDTG